MCYSSKNNEVCNVMEIRDNLKLNIGEEESLRTFVDEKVTASDVEQLFDVENDSDERDAIVSDIIREMEKLTTETPAQEAEENQVEVNEEAASPPSLAQLYATLSWIVSSCNTCFRAQTQVLGTFPSTDQNSDEAYHNFLIFGTPVCFCCE